MITITTNAPIKLPVIKVADVKPTAQQVCISIARIDGKKGKSGMCVVAPRMTENTLQVLLMKPEGKAWFFKQVYSLAGNLLTAQHKAGKLLDDSMINVTALASAMARLAAEKLTVEQLEAWFDETLATALHAKILAAYPTATPEKLAAMVAGYKAAFAKLATKEPSMQVKTQLMNAVSTVGLEDTDYIGEQVLEILTKEEDSTEDLLAALG